MWEHWRGKLLKFGNFHGKSSLLSGYLQNNTAETKSGMIETEIYWKVWYASNFIVVFTILLLYFLSLPCIVAYLQSKNYYIYA